MEGAGGIYCPINDKYTFLTNRRNKNTYCSSLRHKLGAINHSIYIKCSKNKKINVLGWVANCVEKNKKYIIDENIKYISRHTKFNLGIIPYMSKLKNKTIYSLKDIQNCEKFIKLP